MDAMRSRWISAFLFLLTVAPLFAAPPSCTRVELTGEVSAGKEWQAPIGQGWVFRVMPIQPAQAGYSGWDLVVDRTAPGGYPDALLLATPPYNSMNEREIGTTYRLRSEDALGWNPRTFHFLVDPATFREAQQLFQAVTHPSPDSARASARLLELQKRAAAGQFRILDARFVPGIADPAPYAESWSRVAARSAFKMEQAPDGKPSAQGTINWMRFSVTLWLPVNWKLPAELHGTRTACTQ